MKRLFLYLSVLILAFLISVPRGVTSSFDFISTVKVPKKSLKLFYDIYWGPFLVGKSEIVITPNFYESKVFTAGIGSWFFHFVAIWKTYVFPDGHPKKVIIWSKKWGKERQKRILFLPKEGKVIIVLSKPPKKGHPRTYALKYPVYDELSAFVAAFYIDYKKHPRVVLPLFIRHFYSQVKLELKGEKDLKGEKCYKVLVKLPKVSELLRRSSRVEVFLSEKRRIPLVLKSSLPIFGSLVGVLQRVVTSP